MGKTLLVIIAIGLVVSGCQSQASVESKKADAEADRRLARAQAEVYGSVRDQAVQKKLFDGAKRISTDTGVPEDEALTGLRKAWSREAIRANAAKANE